MTITTTQTFIQYPGNGVQTVFTFPFQVSFAGDGTTPAVDVITIDAAGVQTLVPPSLYSVSGVGNPTGGSVTYPLSGSPLDASVGLLISRNTDPVQLNSVSNQSFYPHTLEKMADYLMMIIQEGRNSVLRSVRFPLGEVAFDLPSAANRAGKYLGFDSNGQPALTSGTGPDAGTVEWINVLNPPVSFPPAYHVHPDATPTSDGFMSAADKAKLDSIVGSGGVDSVNGKSGAVLLVSSDIGAVASSSRGIANGVPTLDNTGKVPLAQLPATHAPTVYTAASQAAMLALVGPLQGDLCIRTDTNTTYVLNAPDPSVLGHWTLLPTTAPVTSVNGLTGAVILGGKSSSGLASIMTDYGAVCDGVTDDTTAWNNAIADINAGTIVALLVPGISKITAALSTITKGCAIIGAGARQSGILCTTAGDVTFANFHLTTVKAAITLKDFSFLTDQVNLGQALKILITLDLPFEQTSAVDMSNIQISGLSTDTNGFNRGYELVNVSNGRFDHVSVYGYKNNALAQPFAWLQSAWGCKAWANTDLNANSISLIWDTCEIYFHDKAHWTPGGNCQGYIWTACAYAFNNYAWYVTPTGTTFAPMFVIDNCQTETYKQAIYMTNVSFVQVFATQMYLPSTTTDRHQGVVIENCVVAKVGDCQFNSGDVGVGALGTADCIVFNNVDGGDVRDNRMQGFGGYGIHFTGNSRFCAATNNEMRSPTNTATLYKNDSSNAAQNSRRGQRNVLFGGTTDYETNAASNNATTVGAVTSGPLADFVTVPFPVEVGDRIKVEAYGFITHNANDCYLTTSVREVTHRPGSANPYQVIRFAATQRNWAATHPLSAVFTAAQPVGFAEFEVIATATDAVLGMTLGVNIGNANFSYCELRVTRL